MITILIRVWEDPTEESDELVALTEDELIDFAVAKFNSEHPDVTIRHAEADLIFLRD